MTGPSLGRWLAGCHPGAPAFPLSPELARLRPGSSGWSADEVGRAYERSLAPADRRAAGAFYTPARVADGVVALALPEPGPADVVCDPAAGGGALLLAAARRLEAAGLDRRTIVERHLYAIDRDARALEVAALALALWAGPDEEGWPDARPHLLAADALAAPATDLLGTWGLEGFAAVVGNPPFLGQLRRRTARSGAEARQVERALPDVSGPYTDAAALLLLQAVRLTSPGGRTALLAPESVLSARDAGRVRAALDREAELEHLWIAGAPVFPVAVRVCALVLRRRAEPPTGGSRSARPPVARSAGLEFRPLPPSGERRPAAGGSWGPLLAGTDGVPDVQLEGRTTLGDHAELSAGFRQHYYGIRPFVYEGAEGGSPPAGGRRGRRGGRHPRLVTSGAIDPLECRWGRHPTAFARRRWREPRVDLDGLAAADPTLHRWAVDRLVPKLVVASQTRVVEVAVDVDGDCYPSTPTIAVLPRAHGAGRDGAGLWELAAVLAAPPVSAWLHGLLAGSALSRGHLRLTAAGLRAVPWPEDRDALDRGAVLASRVVGAPDHDTRRARLLELGQVMTAAYGAPSEVLDWWAGALRSRPGA